MAEGVAGITVPEGSPDALRQAAGAWAAVADVLDGQAGRIDSAAGAVVGADWSGNASLAYSATSQLISMHYADAAGACRDAQAACRTFAAELEDVKQKARRAIRRAEDAIDRRDRALAQAAAARDRIAAAETAAAAAAERAVSASAAGPAGAGELAAAEADEYAAASARGVAEVDLHRAEQLADQAREDLREAQRDGQEAERDARRAGRQAGAAFSAVAGAAQAPPVAPVAPVPVSLRGASLDIAAINPVFGGVFRASGRLGSPGQVRAAQIAREQAAAQDAAQANAPRKGSILDGLSAWGHGLSFGVVDLGGDKTSERYRGGDLASMIPISPAGIVRSGERLLAREAVEEGGKAAQRAAERKFWTRTVQFQGRRVYERDDLINPRLVGPGGRSNLERMREGNAPLGPDGREIQLHHTTQMDNSPLAEVTRRFHGFPNSPALHINQPPKQFPSGIDRDAFDAWRERYWQDRAKDFELPDMP